MAGALLYQAAIASMRTSLRRTGRGGQHDRGGTCRPPSRPRVVDGRTHPAGWAARTTYGVSLLAGAQRYTSPCWERLMFIVSGLLMWAGVIGFGLSGNPGVWQDSVAVLCARASRPGGPIRSTLKWIIHGWQPGRSLRYFIVELSRGVPGKDEQGLIQLVGWVVLSLDSFT